MKNLHNRILIFLLLLFLGNAASAQIRKPGTSPPPGRTGGKGDQLDSLRKIDDERQDTIIYSAKYIKYTTLELLRDSTKLLPIDTTIGNFENFSPIAQPDRPTVNLGSLGLPYREMLFNPSRTIGFDPGFHAFDAYLLTQDSIRYYRARAPYTDLYYVNAGGKEQLLKVTHSQNIISNWNFGANYFRNGSEGFYTNQAANHLNAAIFTWFESKNKRYNLLANALFNTIKADENGSPVQDVFTNDQPLGSSADSVRLMTRGVEAAKQIWKQKSFFLKQFYYIGRIDSLSSADTSSKIVLPTQRVSHSINYSSNRYKFSNKHRDVYKVFPNIPPFDPSFEDNFFTNDSTEVRNLRNEFTYSFYLRGKKLAFIKNELKLELGLQHDLYWYEQMGFKSNFQNVTLMARPGYRLSDRVNVEGNLHQIVQGRNAGDFFYEARINSLLSNSVGRIVLGAYSQNKSPEFIFERVNYRYHQWDQSFDRTKINNINFTYQNPKFKTEIKADYFLISNYLYLQGSSDLPNIVIPQQENSNINLLKVTLRKDFSFGKFNLENYIVYQKTDYQDLLRTPEVYTYNSFYFANRFFKVLYANIGFDVRYNTPFVAPSYAININQFYNGPEVKFDSYPVASLWLRASLKRANLFLKYDYANQGLFSPGYYTVNRYPMQDALLKFGVSWKFYD